MHPPPGQRCTQYLTALPALPARLVQATVLITPLLVHMSGDFVHRSEWAACVLGLLGATLVAVDSAHGAVGAREGSA
eukprot:289255-Chlamydomonas_euryale.AAC.1